MIWFKLLNISHFHKTRAIIHICSKGHPQNFSVFLMASNGVCTWSDLLAQFGVGRHRELVEKMESRRNSFSFTALGFLPPNTRPTATTTLVQRREKERLKDAPRPPYDGTNPSRHAADNRDQGIRRQKCRLRTQGMGRGGRTQRQQQPTRLLSS